MNENDDLIDYNEGDALRFIRNHLPQELKDRFSDDDILYVVDLIYDFYDFKGYFTDEPAREEEELEIDEDELTGYVIEEAGKKAAGRFEAGEIRFIVQGELAYCDSLDIFDSGE
jgi:hypothetical protein